jgi:hypothetical protein
MLAKVGERLGDVQVAAPPPGTGAAAGGAAAAAAAAGGGAPGVPEIDNIFDAAKYVLRSWAGGLRGHCWASSAGALI